MRTFEGTFSGTFCGTLVGAFPAAKRFGSFLGMEGAYGGGWVHGGEGVHGGGGGESSSTFQVASNFFKQYKWKMDGYQPINWTILYNLIPELKIYR